MMSGTSAVGGGSAPGLALPTVLLAIARERESADATERWLRTLDPPVIARIEHDRVVLDLRTVLPGDDDTLSALLAMPL
jgi:L-seryl-tRNA(Ser) seleniumtransferase